MIGVSLLASAIAMSIFVAWYSSKSLVANCVKYKSVDRTSDFSLVVICRSRSISPKVSPFLLAFRDKFSTRISGVIPVAWMERPLGV